VIAHETRTRFILVQVLKKSLTKLFCMKCIHGLEEISQCVFCVKKIKKKAFKKTKNIAKSKPLTKKRASTLCGKCHKRAIHKGARGKCLSCARVRGYKTCIVCKKLFIPKRANTGRCGCNRKGRGSVWVVASAGLPSLGRRR
jgi:hypothetical protein